MKRYLFMLALLAGAAALSVMLRKGREIPPRKELSEFPNQLGEWKCRSLGEFPESVMKILNVSDYLNWGCTSGSRQVSLYIGYYRQQRAGESIHSPKNCLPGGGWEILESRQAPLEIPGARKTIEVNHYVVQNASSKQFVLYWYDTHGRAFASEYLGKGIMVWEALKTGRTDGAIIRIMAPATSSGDSAGIVAQDFARLVYPHLKDYLPE